MQQNQKMSGFKSQSRDLKVQQDVIEGAESYLKTLCHSFPNETKARVASEQALILLKEINSTLQISLKNHVHLEDLKKEITKSIKSIKDYLAEKNELAEKDESSSVDLKNIYQNLEKSLREQFIINSELSSNSTGTQYLHSMGFDQIVHMINEAVIHEPEWMSRTGTLMILDNNPNTSQALMRRLTREGHTILNVENETKAFEILRSHKVEAILVDYQMFRDDIYEFLQKIEKDPYVDYIPIVVIGAPEKVEVMQKITECGVGDYLAKPVNPVLLKMRVHAVLEKKHAFEQRVKRSEEMQRTRRELEAAIQDLPDGFAIFDQDNHMVMHNDKLFEFYPHLKNLDELIRGGLTFEKLVEANISSGIYEIEGDDKTKSRQWIEEKIANFLLPASQWEEHLGSGVILGITTYRTPDGGGALVAKDISKDKAQHQDLTFLAYHDSLTSLPNRKAFLQKLTQSIQNMKDTSSHLLAVLFLDLDGFKAINDKYGHEMGDWLLNQVGQRLRRCIRGNDVLARFGGDEFCIILNHAASRAKVKMVATRIIKSISDHYIRNDISMTVGVSIGIGIYSFGIEDSESLLKEADTAMYAVKESGKGQFLFYDEVINAKKSRKPEPTKSPKYGQQNAERPKDIA